MTTWLNTELKICLITKLAKFKTKSCSFENHYFFLIFVETGKLKGRRHRNKTSTTDRMKVINKEVERRVKRQRKIR